MTGSAIRRTLYAGAFLALSAVVCGAVGWRALTGGLDRLEERGRANLALASDGLLAQLQRYRQMAVLTARHPDVLRRARDPGAAAGGIDDGLEDYLRRTADVTRTQEILLLDAGGRVLAGSGESRDGNHGQSASFLRATHGALGFHYERDGATARRVFVIAAPVFAPGGPVIAVVLVRIGIDALEMIWRGEPMIIYFSAPGGVAFVSNRQELVLVRPEEEPASAEQPSVRGLRRQSARLGQHEIWALDAGSHLPSRALHLTRPLLQIGMTGEALVDIAPVERQALLQALVAAAFCLVSGAVAVALVSRRRALAAQLAAEEAANARLEDRVADRTRELSEANERLRRAQAELVQAGKLSALGRMSAGISHELNQPLMAIRSYAENASLFLDRDETGKAAENLGRISDLARRMGRIIKTLRAFARQESEGMSDVDIGQTVAAALELTEARLGAAGVAVDWTAPAAPIWVRGGEVRLQQVVVNLLSNAADAMGGGGLVTLRIVPEGDHVRLSVSDTGPGIAEPERIFDPFYSTKEVGASEGMGLGLSISYGIVKSFSGTIVGRNRPEGGAEFIVNLRASARRADAA